MKSSFYSFKNKAIALRRAGKTYGDIKKAIGQPIPKSTLCHWFKGLTIPPNSLSRLQKTIVNKIKIAQTKAWATNKLKREEYLRAVSERVNHLSPRLKDKNIAKIALAMLFLGEGSKKTKGSLMLGNSDPETIRLYLELLRRCYDLDENKFRCTVQCRFDQNIKELEVFWSRITKIPSKQFYKTQIDPRTIGKPSKRLDYKGVCRIDYFSADILTELKKIIESIFEGL